MKLSPNKLCKKFNMVLSCLIRHVDSGLICHEKGNGKYGRIKIDESEMGKLVDGTHYVTCPNCGIKMLAVTGKHFDVCEPRHESIYSAEYLKGHEKTEDQKKAQSNKLKQRFLTPEGEETRKVIGEASRNFNADPDFKERKKATSRAVNSRPEMKALHSQKSLAMWNDPKFLKKHAKYVKENIEQLRQSAVNARKHLQKTSKLHLGYKKSMLDKNLTGFISEYPYGPYSIDEADPMAKIAVEVDGCYWHGCKTCGYKGDTRIQLIDRKKTAYLKNRGWVIIHVPEHEIKRDPYVCIEMLRNLQGVRRGAVRDKLRKAFKEGSLFVKSMKNGKSDPVMAKIAHVVKHDTPHKRMIKVTTDLGSVVVTEDHSLFDWDTKNPIEALGIVAGSRVVGLPGREFEPLMVTAVEEVTREKHTFDLSVPETENFVLTSGILAHNTYSISGVSLDLEKSSKYQAMKDEYINEYDKLVEANKETIKIVKGLKQFKYGVGITSALGPLNRPGVQSRRNLLGPSY